MALKRDFYKAVEDVIGPEYISDDPVVTESYAFPIRAATAPPKDVYQPRYEAVTLPASTKEVQAIVKLCNKYGVQFKAASTGWLYSDPTYPGCIRIDLRRMNKILEINEKNMYAVVQPYVIYAQLQAELMKRGLNCNVTAAGANCSALPLAAHVNLGHLSQSGSYGERNQLALEWVTGDGEIVRMGSLGSNDEWFCGDGPGPSLRGIIRGNTVPLGGLGVFTAAAQKLYHWPGPATFGVEGVCPKYSPREIPDIFLIKYLSFKDVDMMIEAVKKIGESEIAFELMGFNTAMMASNLGTDNEEDMAYAKKFGEQVQGPGFMILIAGTSPRDFEHKKKVLDIISQETDAWSLEDVEDPKLAAGYIWRYIRETGAIRETSRATGWGGGTVGGTDVFPLMTRYITYTVDLKQELIDNGAVLDDALYPFVQSIEHGHTGHGEILIRYAPTSVEQIESIQGFLNEAANKRAIEGRFGVPQHVWSDELHDMYGPETLNYHTLLRKVKKTFDPNAASESTNYITAKDVEV
ncbi:MAG: FAD-binding oxidoreductase [Dehalococcoidales bacterium]|nr:MAG: FAD-binding oxidoreductase [Dehalococcoidales bacterium]